MSSTEATKNNQADSPRIVRISDFKNQVGKFFFLADTPGLIRLRAGTDPVLQSMVEILERQIDGMVRLLETIVDTDRFSRGDLVLTSSEVDLEELVASAVRLEQPLLDVRKQHVSVTLPQSAVRLQADRDRLTRVLASLLEHVGKDVDEGEGIALEAAIVGDEVRIGVRRRGAGMVAEPSLQSTSGAVELALARSLIELHRGRLESWSGPQEIDHLVVIFLPLLRSEDHDAGTEAAGITTRGPSSSSTPPEAVASVPASTKVTEDHRRRRVLIADDSAAVCESLAALLRDLGHDVEAASSGAETLQRARQWLPEFVLLDIHMPDMSGFAVARELRAQFSPHVMRLIMMSGTSLDETTREGAMQAGFDHCIDKVLSLAALESVLSSDN